MADSTADSTAIIIIDATSWDYIVSDETGVTNVESAVANTLVNDYSDSSQPLLTQANSVFNQLEGIKNEISGINPSDYTPDALLDTVTQQSLDAAFKSSAWLTTAEGLRGVQAVQDNCSVLKKLGKYVDTSSMFDGMKSGVLKDAYDALEGVASQFKGAFPSLSLPEFNIGKRLSALINTGSSAFDESLTEFTEAVSDIIAHGKAGKAKATRALNKIGAAVDDAIETAESAISSMAGPLRDLDGLINCVDTVGAAEFAGKADQMIDRQSEIFTKLGIESDPFSPNYGEFDENAYLDSIGGLTPRQKSKLLKGVNTYNKATNNAVTVVDKAKEGSKVAAEWEKSTSSLAGGESEPPAQKNQYVEDNVKVEVEVPAVPGGAPASTQTPTPTPTIPPVTTSPTAAAEEEILFSTLLEQDANITNPDGTYLAIDPAEIGYPTFQSNVLRMLPPGGVKESIAQPFNIAVVINNAKIVEQTQTERLFGQDDVNWHASATVSAGFERNGQTIGGGTLFVAGGNDYGFVVKEDDLKPLQPGDQKIMIINAVSNAIAQMAQANASSLIFLMQNA